MPTVTHEAGPVQVVTHPLVQHKLTLMRRTSTSTSAFRALLEEISMLMGYELTRDLPLEPRRIETPLSPMDSPILAGKKLVLASVLRAGSGMLEGILKILPAARVGHIGLFRDPKTLAAVEYYFKMPADMGERDVIVCDPMLATGHSATLAVDRLLQVQPRSVKFLCLVAAPEGLREFHRHHPRIPVYTAAVDERLNDHGYIVPGLGDAGDRLFGTR